MVPGKCQYTVPLKSKLTVSTRSSKLDSRVSNVETFEFRDARIEDRGSRMEHRASRNVICKLEDVRGKSLSLEEITIAVCTQTCNVFFGVQCISRPFKSWKSLNKIDLDLSPTKTQWSLGEWKEITFHWHINRLQSEAQKGNYAICLKKNILILSGTENALGLCHDLLSRAPCSVFTYRPTSSLISSQKSPHLLRDMICGEILQ